MCDSVVATRPHTSDGTTIFAKNSNRHAHECQTLLQFPAAHHPRGARVQCTHITIPQVAETYRILGHSPWWVWGFEHGVNEYGVAIGNHSVFSREPVEERAGLIGMDLVRLGLERGRDAREALEIIAALIERHGQGGSGFGPGEAGYHNSFLVVDPERAWLLETTGRRWAARRVDLEAVSNHMMTGSNWSIGSRDLESFARGEGWWRGSGRLDLARAYRNPHVPGCISEGRNRRARALLEAGRGKHDVESMQALLRDHGAGRPTPPIDLAADSEDHYSLCIHAAPVGTTTASLVAPLPVDRSAPWPVWVSFASPCLGFFLPVYLDGVLPASLARGGKTPNGVEGDSAWWCLHRLNEAAARDWARNLPLVREGWRTLEEHVEEERGVAEREARSLAVAGERVEAAGILSEFMSRSVDAMLARAEELRLRVEEG